MVTGLDTGTDLDDVVELLEGDAVGVFGGFVVTLELNFFAVVGGAPVVLVSDDAVEDFEDIEEVD